MKVLPAPIGTLSQGVIFSCGQADRYPDVEVHGLVITARCDVAQNKYPLLNYLPIVPFRKWLCVDGLDIVVNRCIKKNNGSIKSILKECKISDSLLIAHTPRKIYEEFFASSTERAIVSRRDRFLDHVIIHEYMNEVCYDEAYAAKIYEKFESEIKSVISELLGKSLAGYYFLPSATEDNDVEGCVILMREIKYIKPKLAQLISNGLSSSEYGTCNAEIKSEALSFVVSDFAMPVGIAPSPDIEHIMQSFAMLYSRIGLQDPPKHYLEMLYSKRPLLGEAI